MILNTVVDKEQSVLYQLQDCDYFYLLLPSPPSACPSGKWNPPACHGICDMCYNGGICDDKTGECVCPPGFAGRNCLNSKFKHDITFAYVNRSYLDLFSFEI